MGRLERSLRLQSFEAGILASDENLIGLMAVNRVSVGSC